MPKSSFSGSSIFRKVCLSFIFSILLVQGKNFTSMSTYEDSVVYERVVGRFEDLVNFYHNEYACGVNLKIEPNLNIIKGISLFTCRKNSWIFQRKPNNIMSKEKDYPTIDLKCERNQFVTGIEMRNDYDQGFTGVNIYCDWDNENKNPLKKLSYSTQPTGLFHSKINEGNRICGYSQKVNKQRSSIDWDLEGLLIRWCGF